MKNIAVLSAFFLISITTSVSQSAEQVKPYPLASEELISSFRQGNYEAACTCANNFVEATANSEKMKQNKFLALLERGKVYLAAEKYDQCIADLQAAENRFLLIEGTISLGEQLGSLLMDDTGKEYEAEFYEKLMISPYLVLAYLQKGDFENARVERNKTITKINQYIEEKPEERAYLENPLARYLTALIYEQEDKNDDAKIEYKKMKFDAEIERLNNKSAKTSDLVVLIDIGMAPQKSEVKWGPAQVQVPAAGKNVTLGFTYAEYKPSPTEVSKCDVLINDKAIGTSNLLYDLEKTILTQYEKNKSALVAKLVARMTLKAGVQVGAQVAAEKIPFGAAALSLFKKVAPVASLTWINSEKADLRSWLTLPKQIQYLRVNALEPGEYIVKIECGSGSQIKKIKLEKETIGVAYFSNISYKREVGNQPGQDSLGHKKSQDVLGSQGAESAKIPGEQGGEKKQIASLPPAPPSAIASEREVPGQDPLRERGGAYGNLENSSQAIRASDKVAKEDLKDAKSFFTRGLAYYEAGNYQESIRDYDKAIELDSKLAEAYVNRGGAYWMLGNSKQAIEDYKIAARLGHKKSQDFLGSQGAESAKIPGEQGGEKKQIASLPPAPPSAIASEREVRQFLDSYAKRYNLKDLEGIIASFSTRAIQNQRDDLGRIRKSYETFFEQMETVQYRVTINEIKPQQNTVEVRGQYQLEGLVLKGRKKEIWKGQVRWVLVREEEVLKILTLDYQPQSSK